MAISVKVGDDLDHQPRIKIEEEPVFLAASWAKRGARKGLRTFQVSHFMSTVLEGQKPILASV